MTDQIEWIRFANMASFIIALKCGFVGGACLIAAPILYSEGNTRLAKKCLTASIVLGVISMLAASLDSSIQIPDEGVCDKDETTVIEPLKPSAEAIP